jgi:stage V sporulation protein K
MGRQSITVVRPLGQRPSPPQSTPSAIETLRGLVGLHEVKETVEEILSLHRVDVRRGEMGLRTQPQTLHMVFCGNPGTGKTTVARHLGAVLREAGVLSRGHLVEAERADLVGEYIGHTAQRTRALVQRALGGVLFIDEAYALARGGERDFGREAIDTLVKEIEDRRRDLLLILAGYPQEMDGFLRSNPGLVSRLPIILNFPDYCVQELMEIADSLLRERDYQMDEAARRELSEGLRRLLSQGRTSEGNARLARNVVESAIRRHAKRLDQKALASRQELSRILREDLPDLQRLTASAARGDFEAQA